MKVCLVADTHYGVRKNNIHFYNYQKKFVDNNLVPFLEKVKPDAIVHLGDLVDDRNCINYRTHDHLKNDYLDVMKSFDIPQYWIVGNHDIYYKNTLRTNAVAKFVEHGEIISSPRVINIKGEDMTFIPWICDDNKEETFKLLSTTATRYCFGHLEITGFEVRRGSLCKHGYSRNLFENFKTVFSGHFHNRSVADNIKYIGSCFQIDWSDYGEYRGITLLDTEKDTVKYFKNPYNMFNILEYDEDNIPDLKGIKDTYVRIIVKNKLSESKFNDFISEIEDIGVIKCDTIESDIKSYQILESGEQIAVDDLRKACEDIIDSLDMSNGAEVKELFNRIYDVSM